MDLKFLKWHLLRGPLMRRVVLRAFMLVMAIIVVSLMQMAREVRVIEPIMSNVDKCPFNLDSNPEFNLTRFLNSASSVALPLMGASPVSCKESENLTKTVFKELMEKNLLQSNAKALCVGQKSASAVLALRHLGFFNAFGVDRHPFFSLFKRRFVYELNFEDNHFDFVFSEDLDKVSVPALLVLEIERVLRPGGTGAMLVGARELYSGGLVRSATPAASFLKSSDVVHVCGVGSLTLVIFKKRLESFASFERFQLPPGCPSVANNKPFMKYIEPLADKILGQFKPELSYLPNFMNISSRNKLVYINIGAGEYARTSVEKMSKPYCANHHAAFEVFIIDHKTSVLSSYVTDPGINFVYHPALAGVTAAPDISSDEFLSAPMDEEGFDFVRWFKETVSDGDFVVLMMKAKLAELNILVELFKTGAICHVDELFLRCSDAADCTTTMCGDCINLFESLRKSGVYVHQWLGD
ncbi:hypothetical protein Pfo_007216 [Paulownia fortunei]|nr:hypothetical protein Pfo_007216 [Paulownia fortunei]